MRNERRSLRRIGGQLGVVGQPALGVAAEPNRVLELLQALDALARPAAERRVVPAEKEPVGRAVLEDRLQRGEVAVDVVEQG